MGSILKTWTTRVRRAVERLTPHLGVHGLRLDLVEIAGGQVRLRLSDSGAGTIQKPLLWALPREIEDAIVEAAPDAEHISIDGLDRFYGGAASHRHRCRDQWQGAFGSPMTAMWTDRQLGTQAAALRPAAFGEGGSRILRAVRIADPAAPSPSRPAGEAPPHLRLPRLRPSAGKS